MTHTGEQDLVELATDLFATPTSRLPYQDNVLLRSYVLRRPEGNIVIYNSPGLTQAAHAISELGAPTRLLLNHEHESMYGRPPMDVPVWIHDRDAAAVTGVLDIAGTFSGREAIGSDLEVIPTPGHTAGTTSFLWERGPHRYLFTGDFVWTEHGEWKVVVLDPHLRDEYLQSLALIRDLDFDVLVPWGSTEGSPPVALVDYADKTFRIEAMMKRVEAGENR